MSDTLTLMAVHAHPDDESIGTGGILARYAAEGVNTVLVTCTDGQVGEIADGLGATRGNLAAVREQELRAACAILGVRHLELLGYRDSGMAGTPDNDHPDSFAQADLDDATRSLVARIRRFRPQVIVTYDENGFYGHPDHIRTNQITVRAFDLSGQSAELSRKLDLPTWQPLKLYYTAVPQSALAGFAERLAVHGIDPPLGDAAASDGPRIGTPDDLVTTIVDVSSYVEVKRRALYAHATQMGPDVFFARMPPSLFDELFAREAFQLVESRVSVTPPERDLFEGVRDLP